MKLRTTLFALLIGCFCISAVQAQNETPPECLNLADIHSKIGYPIEAKEAGVEGKVVAKVVVNAKGRVESHEIVESPNDILSDAVSKQLKGLKFRAARKDGLPIKSIVHVPILFELPEGPIVYTSIEDALKADGEVLELDLSGKKLNKLDPQIAKLKSLRKLNLDKNAFVKFPGVLTKLSSLKELSISENKLINIPASLKKLKNLQFLDLSGNQLSDEDILKVREMFEDAEVFTD